MTACGTKVELGDVCEFKYGKSLPATIRENGPIPVYGSNGIVGSHSVAITHGPAVIIGRKGSFGEVTYSASECWPIDTTFYVDSTSTRADLKWLAYQLKCLGLTQLNRAAAVPGLNRDDAYRQRLLLPPVDEQRRIAGILDQADAIRAKRRQILSHLDALTQSIFHHMFDSCSEMVQFGEVISAGPTNGLYRPLTDYGSGTPILRIDGFDFGTIKAGPWKRVRISSAELERYSLATGDIVINRVNALSHLGKSAMIGQVNEPSVYESNIMRLRLNVRRAVPKFVLAWLQSTAVKRQILKKAKKAINQASINQRDVKSLLMPLPPRDIQTEFAQRSGLIDVQRALVQRTLDVDNELFASLQARAFRGEL